MPIDAEVPLQVRQQQPINPLADVAQIMQLRQAQQLLPIKIQEAQQDAQMKALQLQETQRQIADRDNMRRSYAASVELDPTTGAPTTNRTKLIQAMKDNNLADQIPAALEGLDKIDKGHADLIDQQNKIRTTNLDYAAGLGAALKANNYNPDFYRQQIQTSLANKDTTPQNAQAILDQLDALDKQDPTGNLARQFTKQHADTAIAQGSAQFQTAQGALQRGASAATQADIAGRRENRAAAEQGYTDAVGALSTNPPKDAAGYQQFVDGLPHGVATKLLQAVPVEQWDPAKSPALLNKSAMTPEQRFRADNPTQGGGDDFEKFFAQWRKDNNAPDSASARLMAKRAWTAAGREEGTTAGTWQLQEDSHGNTVEYNTKTGQTRAAPDVRMRGTAAKEAAANEKAIGPARDALQYANDYIANKNFTGPGDEALQEKFFELAKPSTGFRMTKQQMDMLQQSRGWTQSATALARHAITGTWFSDSQRKQIVDTMAELAAAKMKAQGAKAGGTPAPADPLGIR